MSVVLFSMCRSVFLDNKVSILKIKYFSPFFIIGYGSKGNIKSYLINNKNLHVNFDDYFSAIYFKQFSGGNPTFWDTFYTKIQIHLSSFHYHNKFLKCNFLEFMYLYKNQDLRHCHHPMLFQFSNWLQQINISNMSS